MIISCSTVTAQIVRFETTLGNYDVELRPDIAPNTVANFLNYVNNEDYDNSIVHRVVRIDNSSLQLIQGGWLKLEDDTVGLVTVNASVDNEFNLPNNRGTIAMAKAANRPDSASSQWFINTRDNGALDDRNNNGGYTAFGNVIRGMEVVDVINSLQTWAALNSPSIPLLNYIGGGASVNDYLILIKKAYVLDESLYLNSGLSGAWYNPNTVGQGITIEYLPNSNGDKAFMAWFTYDSMNPSDNETTTIGAVGQRWMSGVGTVNQESKSMSFSITITSGGLFDNPQNVTNTQNQGTMTITFTDCSHAMVDYSLEGSELSGSFPIIRVDGADVALCERQSLNAER